METSGTAITCRPGYGWPVIGPDGEIGWTDRIHTYQFERIRRSDGTAIYRYVGVSLVPPENLEEPL